MIATAPVPATASTASKTSAQVGQELARIDSALKTEREKLVGRFDRHAELLEAARMAVVAGPTAENIKELADLLMLKTAVAGVLDVYRIFEDGRRKGLAAQLEAGVRKGVSQRVEEIKARIEAVRREDQERSAEVGKEFHSDEVLGFLERRLASLQQAKNALAVGDVSHAAAYLRMACDTRP